MNKEDKKDNYNLIYNLPHLTCRCRDKYNKLTPVARIFKEYYDELKNGKEGYQVLNDMKIFKMCCRERFLSIPIDYMIDRSKDRYYNHEKKEIFSEDTRILKPTIEPPNFPILPL